MTVDKLRMDAAPGPAAFDALYRRFARSVHAVLLARLPPSEAEELTQEVFLKAHQRMDELRDPAAAGPWLHALARNAAVDFLRARGRRPRPEPLTDVPGRIEPDGELRERVLRSIQE